MRVKRRSRLDKTSEINQQNGKFSSVIYFLKIFHFSFFIFIPFQNWIQISEHRTISPSRFEYPNQNGRFLLRNSTPGFCFPLNQTCLDTYVVYIMKRTLVNTHGTHKARELVLRECLAFFFFFIHYDRDCTLRKWLALGLVINETFLCTCACDFDLRCRSIRVLFIKKLNGNDFLVELRKRSRFERKFWLWNIDFILVS